MVKASKALRNARRMLERKTIAVTHGREHPFLADFRECSGVSSLVEKMNAAGAGPRGRHMPRRANVPPAAPARPALVGRAGRWSAWRRAGADCNVLVAGKVLIFSKQARTDPGPRRPCGRAACDKHIAVSACPPSPAPGPPPLLAGARAQFQQRQLRPLRGQLYCGLKQY